MSGIQSNDTTFRLVVWIGYELIGGLILFWTSLVWVRWSSSSGHVCSAAQQWQQRPGKVIRAPPGWEELGAANVNLLCKSQFLKTPFVSPRTSVVSLREKKRAFANPPRGQFTQIFYKWMTSLHCSQNLHGPCKAFPAAPPTEPQPCSTRGFIFVNWGLLCLFASICGFTLKPCSEQTLIG